MAAEEMEPSNQADLSGNSSLTVAAGDLGDEDAPQGEDESDEEDEAQSEFDDGRECQCWECLLREDEDEDQADHDGQELEDDDEGHDDGIEHDDKEEGEEAHDGDDEYGDDQESPTTALAIQAVAIPTPRPMATPKGRFALPAPRPFDHATQANHLLNLPREIRDMIWRYAIIDDDREVTIGTWGPVLDLAKVSRQVRHETLLICIKDTTFTLGLHKTIRSDILASETNLLKSLQGKAYMPIHHLRKLNITLAMYTQQHFTGITTTSFFRLSMNATGKGLYAHLHTIPGYNEGPSQESCICMLKPLIRAFWYCHQIVYGTMITTSIAFASSMVQPTGLFVCPMCGKPRLCAWNVPQLRASGYFWMAHANFYASIKSITAKK